MATISDYAFLQGIKVNGGQLVRADTGTFWAIFDREYLEAADTETRVPVLTMRTSDAEKYIPRKGTQVTVDGVVYKTRRPESDGTGMSMVYLES